MRATDIDDGLRLCRVSGWNQVRRDWEQFLALTPDGSCVAEHEGRVVGTVTTVRYGTRFAWIGMVLVDPAVRGRGIGTRLLDHALALLSDMPLVCLDATPAGHALYLSRGFTEEGQIHRLQGVAATPGAAVARRRAADERAGPGRGIRPRRAGLRRRPRRDAAVDVAGRARVRVGRRSVAVE